MAFRLRQTTGETQVFRLRGLGRNVRRRAARLDPAAESVSVVALVGLHDVAIGQAFEKQRAGRAVCDLSAGERKGERAASVSAWILVVRPPREWPVACAASPLFSRSPSAAP